MPTKVQEILLDNEYLNNQNSNFRSYCQDLADYGSPRKAWFNSMRYHGERVNFNFLYDSTLIRSARDLSSGIHSHLTNPTSRWFGIESEDLELRKNGRIRRYYQDLQDWCYPALGKTNFYNVAKDFYHNTVLFGPGTYSILDDSKMVASFNSIPCQQVNRVVDRNGNLMEIYINFKLNVRQAIKMFGFNNLPETIQKSEADKPFDEFDFVHFVGERFDRDVRYDDSKNMKYKSCWIAKKDKHLIAESGFHEMPYISEVFYSDENDPNGFSPAMMVLAETKLVNAMQRTVIRAGMKQTDPPIAVPSRGYMMPINFNPAALNYYDLKNPKDSLFQLPVAGNISISVEMIQMVQASIKDGMFIPLFKTLQDITKQLSILETQQLMAQNMSILGPVIDRYNKNVLGKTIERFINMGIRSGSAPQPPEELIELNSKYEIVYLSPLAKAQKQAEINEVQSFMADVHNIGGIIPAAYDKVDEDKLVDYLHRTRGITTEILRDDEVMAQMRKHREEQNQIIAAMQMGQGAANMAKTGAEAAAVGAGQ